MTSNRSLSFEARKCLCIHLGEQAGNEIANLLVHLESRVSNVERSKVDVTTIVPGPPLNSEQRPHRPLRAR